MAVMVETAGMRGVDPGRPLTVDDLEAMPDDGRRYELLDGMLLVSPAPGRKHQKIVLRLGSLLDASCTTECDVLPAPFAVRPSDATELQPDLLVARYEDVTEKYLPVAPLLAVEVLSPSTALKDNSLKKAAYERLGVPSYWLVDPEVPGLTVFELGDAGEYKQVAEVAGDEVFDAERPFLARVVPTELLI